MDLILEVLDDYVLDAAYARLFPPPPVPAKTSPWRTLISSLPLPLASLPTRHNTTAYTSLPPPPSAWPRDYLGRQVLSISVVTLIGIHVLYFLFAGFSYRYIFNHDMMRHPRFLPQQIRKEIKCSLRAFPGMTLLTLPFFLAEVRGGTKLYTDVQQHGWAYLFFSVPLFLLFTDYCIYWIHRWLHVPFLYKLFHKPHHKWIIPTPFASHAFHPVDGWAQSLPYHIFILLFPMQRHLYLVMFVLVNFWSIFIHDSDMITGHPLEKVINGPAHHTLHHLYFVCNYGQYFTWADRAGKSYRQPESHLDPLLEVRARDALSPEKLEEEKRKQEQEGDGIAEAWEKQVLGEGSKNKKD